MSWRQAGEDLTCPLCRKRMEVLVYEKNGVKYVEAERCKSCGWEWRDGEVRRIA